MRLRGGSEYRYKTETWALLKDYNVEKAKVQHKNAERQQQENIQERSPRRQEKRKKRER